MQVYEEMAIELDQNNEMMATHQTEMNAAQLEVSKLGSLDLVDPQQLLTFEVKLEVMGNDIPVLLLFEIMEIYRTETDVVQHVALRLYWFALVELQQRQIPEPNFEVMGNDLTLYQRIETTEIHLTEMDAVYRVILKADGIDQADLQQLKILEQIFEETANDFTLFQPTEMIEIHQMEMDVVQLVVLKPGGPALVEHHLRQIREVKIKVIGNNLTLCQRIETTEIH